MKFPAWLLKICAAAVFPAAIGVGVAISAPSSPLPERIVVDDAAFQPGMDGVDHAAITGPRGSETGNVPACADPARRGNLRPCL